MDRPKSGMFACLKNVCLTQFASCHYKKSTSEKDYQPEILEEGIKDKDNDFAIGLPKNNVLKKSREVVTRRNQGLVLRYYKTKQGFTSRKVCISYSVTVLAILERGGYTQENF